VTRTDVESKKLTPGCLVTVEVTATGMESWWDSFCITHCGKSQLPPRSCLLGDVRMKGNPVPEGERNIPLFTAHSESNAYTIAGKSYYQLCISLEENWTISGFDSLGGVLQNAIKYVKYIFIFSGWSHLFFKVGRAEWLEVFMKVLAFIRVSFGVWIPDDYDNYFDLQNRFNMCSYQDEVCVATFLI